MPYTAQERREIMARAYAILEETAPYTQRGAVVSRATGPKLVYKTTVQPEPREAFEAPTKLPATTRGNSQQPGGSGSTLVWSIVSRRTVEKSKKPWGK